jgi:uncharacterized protein
LECVKVLIDNGADPTITNAAGHDPVYEAEVNDRREVVEWVLKEGGEGLEEGIGGIGGGEEEEDLGDADIREEERQEEGFSGGDGIEEGMEGLELGDEVKES